MTTTTATTIVMTVTTVVMINNDDDNDDDHYNDDAHAEMDNWHEGLVCLQQLHAQSFHLPVYRVICEIECS